MNPMKFLHELFPLKKGYLEFRLIHKSGRIKQIFVLTGSDYRQVLREVKRYNEQGYNAYFGTATRSRKSGTASDVLYTNCLWVDIDGPRTWLNKYHPPPSIVVNSGHGYQVFWLLEDIIFLTNPKMCAILTTKLKKLCAAVHGDMAATDVARVLRVPGTINWNKKNYGHGLEKKD